jgi:hypothetical protein
VTEADRELVREIRRALIITMRALMKRYGLAWADFLPREQGEVLIVSVPRGVDISG